MFNHNSNSDDSITIKKYKENIERLKDLYGVGLTERERYDREKNKWYDSYIANKIKFKYYLKGGEPTEIYDPDLEEIAYKLLYKEKTNENNNKTDITSILQGVYSFVNFKEELEKDPGNVGDNVDNYLKLIDKSGYAQQHKEMAGHLLQEIKLDIWNKLDAKDEADRIKLEAEEAHKLAEQERINKEMAIKRAENEAIRAEQEKEKAEDEQKEKEKEKARADMGEKKVGELNNQKDFLESIANPERDLTTEAQLKEKDEENKKQLAKQVRKAQKNKDKIIKQTQLANEKAKTAEEEAEKAKKILEKINKEAEKKAQQEAARNAIIKNEIIQSMGAIDDLLLQKQQKTKQKRELKIVKISDNDYETYTNMADAKIRINNIVENIDNAYYVDIEKIRKLENNELNNLLLNNDMLRKALTTYNTILTNSFIDDVPVITPKPRTYRDIMNINKK